MKILFIGDVFGRVGRKALNIELNKIKKAHNIDITIANVENVTHGRGMSLKHYNALKSLGIDYFTFGNHTWYQDDIKEVLSNKGVVRPLNLKATNEWSKCGNGSIVFEFNNKIIRLTNLLGRSVAMKEIQDNPFVVLEELIQKHKSDIHIVDFHSETTSEKNAFLLSFASKVSAIFGTHTHVQTADERIYKNTAYISDVGMTGGTNGVIGAKPETIVSMFEGKTNKFKLEPQEGKYQLNAIIVEFDNNTNMPKHIQRINIVEDHA